MKKFSINSRYLENIEWTTEKAKKEIDEGLKLLNGINHRIITFFGSHLTPMDDNYYMHARETAEALGKQGYAIASGGGPGIMYAANSGAYDAGVPSIGLRAGLLKGEDVDDDVFTHILSFHFMFVRRFILSVKSEALLFYPGGYGTLNELFEYAVLMQTGMMDQVPMICVGREYWNGLFHWLRENLLKNHLLTNHIDDMDILHVVDDFDEIMRVIKRHNQLEEDALMPQNE